MDNREELERIVMQLALKADKDTLRKILEVLETPECEE